MTDGDKNPCYSQNSDWEKYVNVCVPKNNSNWQGPWDCAEFMSWLVYQVGKKLYGSLIMRATQLLWRPTLGRGEPTRPQTNLALGSPGSRQPLLWVQCYFAIHLPTGKMGHIAVSDGLGGTVEAMGKKWGVVAGNPLEDLGILAY